MPTRSVRWRGFGVSVELPSTLVRRRRARDIQNGQDAKGQLILGGSRSLVVRHRDLDKALSFYQSGHPEAIDRPVPSAAVAAEFAGQELRSAVDEFRWYHTIDLPGGVTTSGIFDHRPLVPHYGIPDSLDGKRVLDVATFDGFWAFEFERRGADVTALDLARLSDTDLPPQVKRLMIERHEDQQLGRGFKLARQALGARAQRVVRNIYDIDAGEMGTFDLVHVGDVLLHLQRPLDALRNIRSVTRHQAMIVDCFAPELTSARDPHLLRYEGGWWSTVWWLPSLDALGQMVLDAGFADVRVHTTYSLPARAESTGLWRAVLIATA